MRKAEGLVSPTTFRVRRAVSESSVVQNAVLYIGIENALWVKKSCRKAKDSFNGLKLKSALDRHAAVHWMDTTTSIQLKFMRPLDGQTRYNPIETCVSMGWTQRPPPRAGNLAPGIAAVSPASQPNTRIIPKPPRRNQARIPLPKAARWGGYAGCGLPCLYGWRTITKSLPDSEEAALALSVVSQPRP